MKMMRPLLATALAALLALPAVAQDEAAPEGDQTTTEAPVEGEATGTGSASQELDLGQPVEDGDRPGQPYVAEEFGDWQMRCLRAEEGQQEPCQLYQLLLDQEENPVAEVSVVALPAGQEAAAGVVLVVPLETQLTEGATIRIDGGESRVYEYDFCNRAGCVARFGMTEAQVTQLKRGAAASVRIVPALAPDQEVVLRMSLSGFTAGFDATAELAGSNPNQ